jgi:hypothetical protein
MTCFQLAGKHKYRKDVAPAAFHRIANIWVLVVEIGIPEKAAATAFFFVITPLSSLTASLQTFTLPTT